MAYKIKLSATELKELQSRKQNERDGKVLRRLLCIDMKNKGMQHKEIANYCDVCIDTLTDWLALFTEGGFDALCSFNYEGRKLSKLEKHKEAIQQKQQKEGIENLKDLQSWLKAKYGLNTCISNLFYYCKKNSIFLGKKPE